LKKDEIEEFKDFSKKFQKSKLSIEVAVRRLNFVAQRAMLEDKLIDLMIGFESLYVPDTQGETTFRLSNNTATFLEGEPTKRKELYWIMRSAYSLRGKIVHGGESTLPEQNKISSGKFLSKRDFIDLLEQKLRDSIRRFVLDDKKPRKVHWEDIYWPEENS